MGSESVLGIIAALMLAALISSPFSDREAEVPGCMGENVGGATAPSQQTLT